MAKEVPADFSGFHPFGDLIGLQFVKCEGGQSQCVLKVDQRLLNPHKVVHGGVLYSMADTGMGGAVYTVMEKDELCATIEIKITYFKAVKVGHPGLRHQNRQQRQEDSRPGVRDNQ